MIIALWVVRAGEGLFDTLSTLFTIVYVPRFSDDIISSNRLYYMVKKVLPSSTPSSWIQDEAQAKESTKDFRAES